MKNNLIKLLVKTPQLNTITSSYSEWEKAAEFLIDNGVIVPPCKIGDIIYSIWEDDEGVLQIDEIEVLDVSAQKIWIGGGYFGYDEIGKNVFLTCEEAERTIRGRRNGGDT